MDWRNTHTKTKGEETPIAYVIPPKRGRQKFIKGPLPLEWFERAVQGNSAAAVTVGLLLFYLRGMGRRKIVLSNELASRFSITRNTKARALRALEDAGLISLQRTGQRVVITLCHDEVSFRR